MLLVFRAGGRMAQGKGKAGARGRKGGYAGRACREQGDV